MIYINREIRVSNDPRSPLSAKTETKILCTVGLKCNQLIEFSQNV